MTNEQILKKAIEKAVENGWNAPKDWKEIFRWTPKICYWSIIFSHDFAKEFFGKKPIRWFYAGEKGKMEINPLHPDWITVSGWKLENWQYHIQIMVLEKEPLKYLEKFL